MSRYIRRADRDRLHRAFIERLRERAKAELRDPFIAEIRAANGDPALIAHATDRWRFRTIAMVAAVRDEIAAELRACEFELPDDERPNAS